MRSRLAYLDAIKVLLVVGVIAVHGAITYGLDGSWYLESYEKMPGGVVGGVTILLGTGWLFGLGLFFLIAGRLTSPRWSRACSPPACACGPYPISAATGRGTTGRWSAGWRRRPTAPSSCTRRFSWAWHSRSVRCPFRPHPSSYCCLRAARRARSGWWR